MWKTGNAVAAVVEARLLELGKEFGTNQRDGKLVWQSFLGNGGIGR